MGGVVHTPAVVAYDDEAFGGDAATVNFVTDRDGTVAYVRDRDGSEVAYVADRLGHEHKGKGPGGSQFTAKGGGGSGGGGDAAKGKATPSDRKAKVEAAVARMRAERPTLETDADVAAVLGADWKTASQAAEHGKKDQALYSRLKKLPHGKLLAVLAYHAASNGKGPAKEWATRANEVLLARMIHGSELDPSPNFDATNHPLGMRFNFKLCVAATAADRRVKEIDAVKVRKIAAEMRANGEVLGRVAVLLTGPEERQGVYLLNSFGRKMRVGGAGQDDGDGTDKPVRVASKQELWQGGFDLSARIQEATTPEARKKMEQELELVGTGDEQFLADAVATATPKQKVEAAAAIIADMSDEEIEQILAARKAKKAQKR